MATITRYPFLRHLRTTPTAHVQHLVDGQSRHSGVGAAFWFRPLTAALSEVPVDDRERTVLVSVRTSDLQQVVVPGTVTYRVADPDVTARRVDFSIDPGTGHWTQTPLEVLGEAVHGATTDAVVSALTGRSLADVMTVDLGELGAAVHRRLGTDESVAALGLEIVGVRLALIRPEPDVERALQTPAREAIQQEADKATFERRALAVEREAAIGENELANQVELARRREALIDQEGLNARRVAEGKARAAEISTTSEAARTTALAEAQAAADRAVGEASADTERAKIEAYAGVPRELLLALAMREAAEHLPDVEHLVVTPDLVQGLLSRLTATGTE